MTPLEFFARELRQARECAGMSQSQLAAAIVGYSASFVAMVETARRVPKPDFAQRCDQLFSTGGILTRLAEDLVCRDMPPEWTGKWLSIEDRATALLSYEPLVIPGLLQTEPYARALLAASGRQFDVDDLVSARMERQGILKRERPPMLIAVMDEGVVRRHVGGPKVMHDQLMHLIDVSERSDLIIQIVPSDSGVYAGLAGAFVVASFDDRDVVYVDSALRGDVVERSDDVTIMRRMWEVLRAEALPKSKSIDLLVKVAKTWE
ncbi:helix-turn-helix transcriptional regulator [Sphaerisporangium rubeum]|uniref:Transcriptional regulator with XRE-family HTH domain n=1 Tax=Sphaerisporangium rubeum TaxID=321317 RepID=A0A7X0M7W6_9ACTN|nr:helix-turn-helix transcriptional regulator [Sphaerisporangium rubeum]MBB6474737.1 transcriptional regulator with XRE-family HTH domain [Sphaerisporangium rubeum]